MTHLPSMPRDAVLLDLFKMRPDIARPLLEMHAALMQGPANLSIKDRELIAAYVSATNHCDYCQGVHQQTAERFGVEPGLLQSLLADLDSANVDEELRAILCFAKKLATSPSQVSEQDTQRVLDAGVSEDSLVEIIYIASLFSMMNRLIFGCGIEADTPYFERAASRIQEQGYTALVKILQ